MKKNKILVTGAAGYIGGTFTYEALKNGFKVHGIDNFINSNRNNIDTFSKDFPEAFNFSEMDLAKDVSLLKLVLDEFNPDFIIHFAGLKSVGESEKKPDLYMDNNVGSTRNLLENMNPQSFFIFSSSATVYGNNPNQPLTEASPIEATSVYGQSKIECENLIKDYAVNKGVKSICLRYFNPVGSHQEFIVVEDYLNQPNNLMPKLIECVKNGKNTINVYGNDYETRDGTGERDYIHIIDLVEGHIAAMDKVQKIQNIDFFNLGTGQSTTVVELISTFNKTNIQSIKINYVDRRKGDVAICYSNPLKAHNELNWQANLSLERMCKDSWEAVQQ
ncbi:MAG: UDP-glucose 4-epimerase GalE [Gammaproteobacteria bacterium]